MTSDQAQRLTGGGVMTRRQERIAFFQENGGYVTPPGRMVCAKSLADAEALAAENDWTFEWVDDPDADVSWLEHESEDYKRRSYFMVCVLRDASGEFLDSLHGIHFLDGVAGRDYERVVEAELAREAS